MKIEEGTPSSDEDAVLRDLRLNLLALAKRAPLDSLAKLPMELVPPHIRHFIPSIAAPG
jgi:bromodomain-containing protein 7/9